MTEQKECLRLWGIFLPKVTFHGVLENEQGIQD